MSTDTTPPTGQPGDTSTCERFDVSCPKCPSFHEPNAPRGLADFAADQHDKEVHGYFSTTVVTPHLSDGWDRPPAGFSDDWDLFTDVGTDTDTTDQDADDLPGHGELLISEACRLLDDTEFYAVENLGEEGTGESRMVPRTDEEAAAKVRLSGAYAAIATAEAVESLDDTLCRLNEILAGLSGDVAGGLLRLGDTGVQQTAMLAELSSEARIRNYRQEARAAALVDAEFADSVSRAGFYALGALLVALWAAIGGPRPDWWSWLPQGAVPGWLAGAAALVGIALAAGGALITATRYADAHHRRASRP